MSRVRFEWDATKDSANQAKHGVSFVEAQYAFEDVRRVIAEDEVIRIFGAGYWRRGLRIYEEANQVRK